LTDITTPLAVAGGGLLPWQDKSVRSMKTIWRLSMKPGDLVKLKCFPPIELGFGANPKSGIIVRPSTKFDHAWMVLLEGKEFIIAEAGLEVINESR